MEAEEDAKKVEQVDVAEETLREVERIKNEVQEAVGKRKAAEPVPMDEVVISKKARVVDETDEDDDDEDEEDESDDSGMEDWQREAAEQLAKEAEEEKQRQEEERKLEEEDEKTRQLKEAETQKGRPLNMPDRVDLSIDEARALFKVCDSSSI